MGIKKKLATAVLSVIIASSMIIPAYAEELIAEDSEILAEDNTVISEAQDNEVNCFKPEEVKSGNKQEETKPGNKAEDYSAYKTVNVFVVLGGKVKNADLVKHSADKNVYDITCANESIANVTDRGYVYGNATGQTTATVKKADATYKVNITVFEPKFDQEIYVTNIGDVFQLGFDAKGLDVTYTASKPEILNVDANGRVQALQKGSSSVKAVVQGKSYRATVKVYNPYIKGDNFVYINSAKPTKLRVSGGTGTTTWKSKNEAIATVDQDGNVKGVSKGETFILGTNNGRTMWWWIKTFNAPYFKDSLYTVEKGGHVKTNLVHDCDLPGIWYSSSDWNIASVNGSGFVTGCNPGTVKITAYVGDTKVATVRVKVTEKKIR